jgi:hypothetical protein
MTGLSRRRWRVRVPSLGLLALGVLLLSMPDAVPGLTIPPGGSVSQMDQMSR